MMHIAAREARANFAELIDNAQHQAVTIERHGREVAVMLSAREYAEMKKELLKARLELGEMQIKQGQGIDLTPTEIIARHKASKRDA